MAKTASSLSEAHRVFIQAQEMFFVATAPLDAQGHVNLSPKGRDTFRILGPTTVAYLDLTGSGVETIAHLRENGRIVVMFCAFQGPPNILRLHGRGRAVRPEDSEFARLQEQFPVFASLRSIIVVEVFRVSDSCGYGVPLMQKLGDRPQLDAWASNKGPEGLKTDQKEKNRFSIDALPGLD